MGSSGKRMMKASNFGLKKTSDTIQFSARHAKHQIAFMIWMLNVAESKIHRSSRNGPDKLWTSTEIDLFLSFLRKKILKIIIVRSWLDSENLTTLWWLLRLVQFNSVLCHMAHSICGKKFTKSFRRLTNKILKLKELKKQEKILKKLQEKLSRTVKNLVNNISSTLPRKAKKVLLNWSKVS
jgi:hypothetical protein